MSQKIFVSNLPINIANETVAEKFSKFGLVYSAKVEREAERSTGNACVEMAFSEDAEKAIKNLDGTLLDGYLIKVTEVKNCFKR
jgi:RNA recognition motif-containing protein